MNNMTAFQRDILYVIQSKDEPNGLDIKSELEEYYEDDVNHGRLYPNLDGLADLGLIIKGTQDKRTNKYELSERGQQKLKTRLEWELYHVDEMIEQPEAITIETTHAQSD